MTMATSTTTRQAAEYDTIVRRLGGTEPHAAQWWNSGRCAAKDEVRWRLKAGMASGVILEGDDCKPHTLTPRVFFAEVEPVPSGQRVPISVGAIVDAVEWPHELPREQR